MKDGFAVILVANTSRALRAEKILGEAGLACALIPVPRALSSDCGICIRIGRAAIEAAGAALGAAKLEIDAIHEI